MFGSVCRPKCKQRIISMNCKTKYSGTFQYAVSDFTPWPIDMQAFSVTAVGSMVIATHIGGTLKFVKRRRNPLPNLRQEG